MCVLVPALLRDLLLHRAAHPHSFYGTPLHKRDYHPIVRLLDFQRILLCWLLNRELGTPCTLCVGVEGVLRHAGGGDHLALPGCGLLCRLFLRARQGAGGLLRWR